MKAHRTLCFTGGPEPLWAALAATIAPAGGDKEGFYLTLFPDGKPAIVVFLRPDQARRLCEMAKDAAVTDGEVWDFVAKIPMEPLGPSRSLQPRLRALLSDFHDAILGEVTKQANRPRKLAPPLEEEAASPQPEAAPAPSESAPPLPRPDEDPFSAS